jgi:predicted SAM-dependent methyltransferase
VFARGKAVIKNLLVSIWPGDLLPQVIFESKAAIRHYRTWFFDRSKYRGKRDLKLNIGCGSNIVAGWINIDLGGPSEVFHWDCRRGLPFDNESVIRIFAEHVFEHLDPVTGSAFLQECRRCLQPAGVLRIIVPDAGKYLRLYLGEWSDLASIRPLIEEHGKYRDFWLGKIYRTKMEFINEVFRQGTEHKYAYDEETLILKMRDANFKEVKLRSYGVTAASEPPLDSKARSGDSLYAEGTN